MRLRPRTAVLAAALVAGGLTLLVWLIPDVRFAYEAPALHVAIDAAAGVVGAVAAFLLLGRLLRTAGVRDLALALGLGLFAFTNLFFSALPAAIDDARGPFATWTPLVGRLLGAVAFALAAVLPDRRLRRPRRAAALGALAAAAVLAVVGVSVALAGSALPVAVDPSLSPTESNAPLLEGNAVVLATQAVQIVLFGIAALGFLRRAEEDGDQLLAWFAVGAVLAAFARVNYLLFPSLYSDWFYTGDILRFAFYVLLLVASAGEIRRQWQRAERAAVLEERRRIARNLHDGIAQELAYIAMQSRRLSGRESAEPGLSHLASAADRALGEARRAIDALARDDADSLPAAVAEVAEEISGRAGLTLDLRLMDDVDVAPDVREELVRVVREAVTNAAKHASATRVSLELANGDGITLVVADDGVGFDTAARRAGEGFGLTTMAERVRSLGGDLRVRSAPGAGTRVEIELP